CGYHDSACARRLATQRETSTAGRRLSAMMHAELARTGPAVLTRMGGIVLHAQPAPVIARDEIAIRVEAVGIWGYEVAGRIVHLGADVTAHRVGDRVVVVPGVPCGACQGCRSGRASLCPDVEHPAMRAADGT